MSETGKDLPDRAERRLLSELRTLHLQLPLELEYGDALDAARELAGPMLRSSAFEPAFELAWLLANELHWVPFDDEGEDPRFVRYALAAPRRKTLARYLASFPPGDRAAAYRRRRLTLSEAMWFQLHPSQLLLQQLASGAVQDPAVRQCMREHIDGPSVCLRCRRSLRSLRSAEQLPLAAADAADNRDDLAVDVEIGDGARGATVGMMDDGGFLRLFLSVREEPMPEGTYRFTVVRDSGQVTRHLLHYPGDAETGVNAGSLHGQSLEAVSVLMVALVDSTE